MPLMRKMQLQAAFLLLISSASAFWLTGCWDAREIDRRAFIFVMGIDLKEDGLYRVSAIAVRGRNPDSSVGTTTNDAASKAPVMIAQGRTVAEAMDALAGNSARSIDWGNLRSIILGETLSQKGVNEIVHTALADPRTPADVILFQAQGPAEALVRSEPTGEEHLQAWLDHYRSKSSTETPAHFFVPAWQFRAQINNPGKDAYLGAIALHEGAPAPMSGGVECAPQPLLSGVAAFQSDRLRGFLNADQAVILAWMSGKAGGLVVVNDPQAPDNAPLAVRIKSLRRSLAVSSGKSTAPVLRIKIQATGAINGVNNMTGARERELASLTAAQMKKQITATALIMQEEFAADLLGFGELARRAAPFEWRPSMWENQWNQAVWDVTVEVSLQAQGRYQY